MDECTIFNFLKIVSLSEPEISKFISEIIFYSN